MRRVGITLQDLVLSLIDIVLIHFELSLETDYRRADGARDSKQLKIQECFVPGIPPV
jgi:hypothetical protein